VGIVTEKIEFDRDEAIANATTDNPNFDPDEFF
jgi:hypothetical protein